MKEGALADDITEAINPIEIEMRNCTHEKSIHTYYLRTPSPPKVLRKVHIVPGLTHSSLVSIKKLCIGGCEVKFKDKESQVWYKNKQVLTGRSIGPGGLWVLPIGGQQELNDRTPSIS